MKMAIFEKWFINSDRHGEQVINRADRLLMFVDVKENQKYLEVGCGTGSVARHVAGKYLWDVTAVDVDPEQIKQAQENSRDLKNIRFLAADAMKLPFPDKDFDIVLSFGTTHHISNWLAALGEIRRVLKPDGYFVYYDLVYSGFFAKMGRSFKHSYGIVTMPELDTFMETNNLSEVHATKRNSVIWYDYEVVCKSV